MPIWKPAAVADRKAITAYIAQDNPRAAVELGDLLIEKATQLDQHPARDPPGRMKGRRELMVHRNYILAYRESAKGPEILRVLHAAQEWPPAPRQAKQKGARCPGVLGAETAAGAQASVYSRLMRFDGVKRWREKNFSSPKSSQFTSV